MQFYSRVALAAVTLTGAQSDRAQQLLDQMTDDEKINMLQGTGWAASVYVGKVAGIPRLGIPALNLNDGPQGYRCNGLGKCPKGTSTCFPSGGTMAASWDPEAVRSWGAQMGKEFWGKGANVQLGPGLCVARVPVNGRNFEYLSGEDPYLGKVLAKPAVEGIQSQGVVANAKHWAFNNQETDRNTINVEVDERTKWEVYYPPFQGAVDAGVGSFMCSYNKEGGKYSCENNETLNTDLRERMGFKGWVMSDWRATHSTSIMEGLDQEMPESRYMNDALKNETYAAALNQSVLRILRPVISLGILDNPNNNSDNANVSTAQSMRVAQDLATRTSVLVKNDNQLLPVDKKKVVRIALVGHDAVNPTVHGGGSGEVDPSYLPTPFEVLSRRLADAEQNASKVVYAFDLRQKGDAALVASADLAVVFVSLTSAEGRDRKDLSYGGGDALVEAVAAVQPNTVVVAVSPGAVLMPWADKVRAIMMPFTPGQMFAEALADLLLGEKSPSARLPLTMPNKDNEVGFTADQYPGVNGTAHYTEGLLIGYRWYDAHSVTPKFCFGHGLSYTSFEYSELKTESGADSASLSFMLRNTGSRAGSEVPQLYLAYPQGSGEPPKVLRGFDQVNLAPGESKTVTFDLASVDLSIWDVETHGWALQKGEFTAMVGASSCDIRLQAKFAPQSAAAIV